MRSLEHYIEAVKTKLGHETYPETMRYLGMQKQAWTNIQKGSGVSEKNAIRIAEILGIDPAEVMAISMALRAKNKEAKNLWMRVANDYENKNSRRSND